MLRRKGIEVLLRFEGESKFLSYRGKRGGKKDAVSPGAANPRKRVGRRAAVGGGRKHPYLRRRKREKGITPWVRRPSSVERGGGLLLIEGGRGKSVAKKGKNGPLPWGEAKERDLV